VTETKEETLTIDFEKGEICGVNGISYSNKVDAIRAVEAVGCKFAIGRDMHVGDTIIGIKGRVGFEAAGPMLIINAHKMLKSIHSPNGSNIGKISWKLVRYVPSRAQYLEPVMRDMEAFLQSSQANVTGRVIINLRPYSYTLVGVQSDFDLMKGDFGVYGEEQKAWTADDVKGFTKILGNQMKIFYSVQNKNKQ
jgi:argininosuccinate synthase